MRFVGPEETGWVEALREVAEGQRAELDLELPGWPVYGLADSVESGWLAGWSRQDGMVVTVQIGYGLRTDESWLLVETQSRTDTTVQPLDWVLASVFAQSGEDYPVPGVLPPARDGLPDAPRAEPVDVTADTVTASALVQRVQGYVAWRLVRDDVVVTVVGRGVTTLPGLVRLTDLGSYAARRGECLAALHTGRCSEPSPLTGPDETQPLWAHHGLLTMTIASHTEHAAKLAMNRPHPPLVADWGARWEAAIRRQRQLREQGMADARQAVTAMVAQVGDLQDGAAWWKRDELRRRALNEIVWVTATGEWNVPSAEAQRAWADDRRTGLDAWQRWADGHRSG
ncbi:hypothetical protein BDK92_5958 [Micromonospora pisi]|uniref:Uncharacterized protein n=1 Tax=Micromonospora pisi TaxID=589240 RepID=A0A495JSQ2_9ACTN|nr:hypothetical protein [Micromonospora pisi]RKR91558.1 hypothetical protein BDK92_5958 [Micromonospora pisi]